MAFTTLNLGLSLQIPTNGTRNWGTNMRATTWTKISSHDHTGSGNGTQVPTAGLVDRSVTSAKLAINWGEVQAATVTPVGSTQTLDLALGKIHRLSLVSASGDVTATISNPVAGASYTILIVQGATPRDMIWPASVLWANGQKPILTELTSAQVAKAQLYYDGTNYFGDWDLNYI